MGESGREVSKASRWQRGARLSSSALALGFLLAANVIQAAPPSDAAGTADAGQASPEPIAEDDDFLDRFGGAEDEDPFLEDGEAEEQDESEVAEQEGAAQEPDTPVLVVEPTPPPSGARAPSENIEEILVTGESTQGVAEDAAVSVTAFDALEIAALGAQDISDLARFTPSLEINTVSATAPTFFIRGVGLNDFNSNAAGAVAIYGDGVPLNAPAIQLGQLFDVENVEILKGPQGYTNARNASGGKIETYTNKPDGELSASLRSDFGNFGFRDFEGALGFPVLSDILAGRLAFRVTERDPITDNGCGGAAGQLPRDACNGTLGLDDPLRALPDEVNDRSSWAARGQLLYRPATADMEWLLNVHGGRLDQLTALGQVIGTGQRGGVTRTGYIDPAVQRRFDANRIKIRNQTGITGAALTRLARETTLKQVTRDISIAKPFDNEYNLTGKEQQDSVGGFLRGDLTFGDVTATTITGAEYYDRTRISDFDFSPNSSIHLGQEDNAWQFTQNLSLQWEHSSVPAGFELGGYYLMENLDSSRDFDLRNPSARIVFQNFTQDLKSVGAFANFSWEVFEDLELEGGVRFNWEQKEFEIRVARGTIFGLDAPPGSSLIRTWSSPTGGLGLTYHFNDEISAYLKYTRGWKAGHVNASVLEFSGQSGEVIAAATPSVATPEKIDSIETGFSGSWFDGQVELNGSLFFYQYQDYQVFVIENQFGSPPQLEVINADDARVWGTELDFTLRPLIGWVPEFWEPLVLSGRFGWLEGKFLDFVDTRVKTFSTENDLIVISDAIDFTGNRLPNMPRFKFSGTAEYTFDFGRFGSVIPRYDLSWTDDIFFDPSEGRGAFGALPKFAIGQRANMRHDLRLSYLHPSGNLKVSGWVRNVTDETYKRLTQDVTQAFASLLNFVGDPRTFGVSIEVSF